jgi:asparagine synthase (glutamine-hydrolysing)
MCGILAFVRCYKDKSYVNACLGEIAGRGPDATDYFASDDDTVQLGFNRLCINDLTIRGMQPMSVDGNTWLICNGEIFNHLNLQKKYDITTVSKSDCEVILHMYHKLPFSQLVNELDGEFAFVIYDSIKKHLLVSRDRYGVRPLFVSHDNNNDSLAFASELKALKDFPNVRQFVPGQYLHIDLSNTHTQHYYYTYHSPFQIQIQITYDNEEQQILKQINSVFKQAVRKRLMSERPICCLLSGGLDSSLVAAIVATHFPPFTVKTFSIGFKGSPDLFYAKRVAEHIKSVHHQIEVDEGDFLRHIEETINTIESYDTTSVRASVGNLMLAKYIKNNTDCKVVFNGDYSDEVCGGYKYFKKAPSSYAFDAECRRLVQDICFFDSLRSDRSISSQGLEARVPFADNDFVSLYLSIPPYMRLPSDTRIEKYLLRKAFEDDNLLPHDILWRPKEAFSDGVSKPENSWHKIVQTHVDALVTDDDFTKCSATISHNRPAIKESFYYRRLFNNMFPTHDAVVPYFWLPKWCGESVVDPSAREI